MLVPLLLLAAGRLFAPAFICCEVDNTYNRHVGVVCDPRSAAPGVLVVSRTARVTVPAQMARAGLAGTRAGDRVVFRNHHKGW